MAIILVLSTYLSIGGQWILNERMTTPAQFSNVEECLDKAKEINMAIRSYDMKRFKIQAACTSERQS